MTTSTETLSARLDDADAAVAAAADRLLDLAAELVDVLGDIVRSDADRRATAGMLGITVRRRDSRELVADVLLDAMSALRPFVPATTQASAAASSDALRLPTRDLELATDEADS